MVNEESNTTSRKFWWWGLALVVIVGLVLWSVVAESPVEGDPDEQRQAPSTYEGPIPGIESAPDEAEIEDLDNGPLHRPPGTAPADIRRPATAPYDSSSRPGSSGEEDEPEPTVDEEDEEEDSSSTNQLHRLDRNDDGDRGVQNPDDDSEPLRQAPPHLATDRSDRQGDSQQLEDSDAERDFADVERWVEELEEGEVPEDRYFDEEQGEWVELDAEVSDEAYDAYDEPYDENYDEVDDIGELRDEGELAQGESYREYPVGDDIENDVVAGQERITGPVGDGSRSGGSEVDGVAPPNATGNGDQWAGAPQSEEALSEYQDSMEEAGDPAAGSASAFAAVASQGMANALYRLSAGRTLSTQEAQRQRDDIVDSTSSRSSREDEDSDRGVEQEFQEEFDAFDDFDEDNPRDVAEEREDPYDDEWTVWIDAADWLRYVQEEEYPQLAELVDRVEEAAEQLDPELSESEQLDELLEFFDAVEAVLEEMAAEEERRRDSIT